MADQITDDNIHPGEISKVIGNRICQLKAGSPSFLTEEELYILVSEITDQEKIADKILTGEDGREYIKLTRTSDIAIREFNLGKCNLTVVRWVTPTYCERIAVNDLIRPKLEYLKY